MKWFSMKLESKLFLERKINEKFLAKLHFSSWKAKPEKGEFSRWKSGFPFLRFSVSLISRERIFQDSFFLNFLSPSRHPNTQFKEEKLECIAGNFIDPNFILVLVPYVLHFIATTARCLWTPSQFVSLVNTRTQRTARSLGFMFVENPFDAICLCKSRVDFCMLLAIKITTEPCSSPVKFQQ